MLKRWIFIFDENITKKLDTNDHRLAFIKSQLNNLNKELIKFKGQLNSYSTDYSCRNY